MISLIFLFFIFADYMVNGFRGGNGPLSKIPAYYLRVK